LHLSLRLATVLWIAQDEHVAQHVEKFRPRGGMLALGLGHSRRDNLTISVAHLLIRQAYVGAIDGKTGNDIG
jgi:hypothetical protein